MVQKNLETMFADKAFSTLTSEKKRKHINAILRVLKAMKLAVKPDACEDAFRRSGRYPLDTTRTIGNFNLSDADGQLVEAAIPALAEIFAANGEIKDEEMHAHGVPTTIGINGAPRDQRSVSHRRALTLTQPDILKTIAAERKQNEENKAKKAAGRKRKAQEDVTDEIGEGEIPPASITPVRTPKAKKCSVRKCKSLQDTCRGKWELCAQCQRLFCPQCVAVELFVDHKKVCRSKKAKKE